MNQLDWGMVIVDTPRNCHGDELMSQICEQLRSSKRGLIMQLAGLGDLVMAKPAIERLQAAFPLIQWTLLTRPAQGELLAYQMDEVRTMPWPPAPAVMGDIVRTVKGLRRSRFDVAINLYAVASFPGILAMRVLLAGIHPRLSVGRLGGPAGLRGWPLFDVNHDDGECSSRHEVDLNLELVGLLGANDGAEEPVLSANEEAVQRMSRFLCQQFAMGKRLAVLFPGGSRRTRHWPLVNYRLLASYLGKLGLGVCVVGGSSEDQTARVIADAAGVNGVNLAGRLLLDDLIALLTLASVYVGNDSGPTHVAAALGIPCLALFGPGDAARFSPRGQGPVRVLQYHVDCSPCYLQSCSHHTCMRSLTLEEVIIATWDLLEMSKAVTS